MSFKMPEQPKFIQFDPKWKPKGHHTTIFLPWESFIKMLEAQGRIRETDKVAAVYVYERGIMLDVR